MTATCWRHGASTRVNRCGLDRSIRWALGRVTMRVAWAAGLSLLLSIGFGNDAAAQTRAQLWANCNASDPDLRISGCTSLIQSNKETTDKRADAFNKRGIAYKDKGDYDRAIQDYDQAIRLSPKNAAAFDNRGVAYAGKGQYDRAIQDYDQAI